MQDERACAARRLVGAWESLGDMASKGIADQRGLIKTCEKAIAEHQSTLDGGRPLLPEEGRWSPDA
jgi:hypothetical protein